MCLIIHKPAGKTIPASVVDSAFNANSDGFGIMWYEPKDKTYGYFKALYKTLAPIKKLLDRLVPYEAGIHFRLKTHGNISIPNCHPIPILLDKDDGRTSLFMHNGVFGGAPDVVPIESDTFALCKYMLNPIFKAQPFAIEKDSALYQIIDKLAGVSNRVLVLDSKTPSKFIRFGYWSERDGIYYSNLIGQSHVVHVTYPQASFPPYQSPRYSVTFPPTVSTTSPAIVKPHALLDAAQLGSIATLNKIQIDTLQEDITRDPQIIGDFLKGLWGRIHASQDSTIPTPFLKASLSVLEEVVGGLPYEEDMMGVDLPTTYAWSWINVFDLAYVNLSYVPHLFALRFSPLFPRPWDYTRTEFNGSILCDKSTIVAFNVKKSIAKRIIKNAYMRERELKCSNG